LGRLEQHVAPGGEITARFWGMTGWSMNWWMLTSQADPGPDAGQVSIDVSHAGVGLADILFRRGDLANAPGRLGRGNSVHSGGWVTDGGGWLAGSQAEDGQPISVRQASGAGLSPGPAR
jgi:hypothetical protein